MVVLGVGAVSYEQGTPIDIMLRAERDEQVFIRNHNNDNVKTISHYDANVHAE